MLTRADDYPVHQTSAPVAEPASADRNFYNRYFFNGYARDGSVFFAAALGLYPNRGVIDAAFNVVYRDRQYIVRASARAGEERMHTRVGPIAVEVLEPLHQLRLVVEPNPWEISADLVFTGRVPPLEEPRFRREHGGRVFMDYTRLTQHVDVRGSLQVAGTTLHLTPDRYWGSRDRSWGIRPVGEREPDAFPGPLQFFWLWSPVNFEDLCTHFDVNEEADGTRWHQAGMLVPVGGAIETCVSVDHRVVYRPGTRHAQSARVLFRRAAGEELSLSLTPLYNFYMVGLGYQHPQWGHGMRVADYAVDGESWALKDIDPALPLHLHVQAVCEARLGTRSGIGVFEQLILGPHEPSGFKELFDTAPAAATSGGGA